MNQYNLRRNENFPDFRKTDFIRHTTEAGKDLGSGLLHECPLSLATPNGLDGVFPIMDAIHNGRSARTLAAESDGGAKLLQRVPFYLFDTRMPEPDSFTRVSIDGCINDNYGFVAVWLRTSGMIAKAVDLSEEQLEEGGTPITLSSGGERETLFGLHLDTGKAKKKDIGELARAVRGFDDSQPRLNPIQVRIGGSGSFYLSYKNQLLMIPLENRGGGRMLLQPEGPNDRLLSFDCLDDNLYVLLEGDITGMGKSPVKGIPQLISWRKNLRTGSDVIAYICDVPREFGNVAARPSSNELWLYSKDGHFNVFDTEERAESRPLHLPLRDIRKVTFSNRGERLNIVHGDFPNGWMVSQYFIDFKP